MSQIIDRGTRVEVITNADNTNIRYYSKTNLSVYSEGDNINLDSDGTIITLGTYEEITSPDTDSVQDCVEAIDSIINTGVAALDGLLEFHPNDFDVSLTSASIGIVSTLTGNYIAFDAASDEEAVVGFKIPEDFDDSVNPQVEVYMFPVSAQSAGSDFRVSVAMRFINEGELINKALDEELKKTVTVSNTALELKVQSYAFDVTNIEAGDAATLKVVRYGNAAADDRNGDAGVYVVSFRYKRRV